MAFSGPECQKPGTLRTRATLPRMKKGPLAEALIARYLRDRGFTRAERNPKERQSAAAGSRNDINGIPGLYVSVKNEQKMSLAEWIDEALREAQESEYPVVWHKRRAKTSPADWYVTMTGKHFTQLWMATELLGAALTGPGGSADLRRHLGMALSLWPSLTAASEDTT